MQRATRLEPRSTRSSERTSQRLLGQHPGDIMSEMKRRPKKRAKRLKAGDAVVIQYGDHDVPAVVLEDRGFIGTPPERCLLIQIRLAHVSPDKVVEVAADRVRPAPRSSRRRKGHRSEALPTAEP